MSASRKKIGIFITMIIFAAVLGLVVLSLVRTNWVAAFADVDFDTAHAIAEVLELEGIRTNIDLTRGIVYVPADQVDAAWMTAQVSPVMLQDRFTFSRAVEESGAVVTQDMQQHMILRARETEIKNILMTLDAVTHADVLLTNPNAHMLNDEEFPPAAVITVKGYELLPADGLTFALMASRAVEGLLVENITVIDAENNVILFNNGEMSSHVVVESVSWVIGEHRGLFSEEMMDEIYALTRSDVNFEFIPGVFASDFPGEPLFAEGLGEGVVAMLENEVIRRYIADLGVAVNIDSIIQEKAVLDFIDAHGIQTLLELIEAFNETE